ARAHRDAHDAARGGAARLRDLRQEGRPRDQGHAEAVTMTETADVVIVGAGIMGASTAYHLARRGAGRVVVLERDTVCSGSTALASGGIRHQYANRLGIELTTHSIVTYERFEDEFGVDPKFRQHGYLILVTTED